MNTGNKIYNSQKVLFANVLKIVASFAVVMIHVASYNLNNEKVSLRYWSIMNFYNSLFRFAVPIFVMVTGLLLLSKDKEIPLKKIFIKYIKKIVILLVIWSTIYHCLFNQEEANTIKDHISQIIQGYYHLWYLYMLIGLYIVLPILKKIVNNSEKRELEYFLILWFILQCVIGTLVELEQCKVLNAIYVKFKIELVLGYSGYLILGYYLNTYSFNKAKRNIIYFLGMLGSVIIMGGSYYLKINNIHEVEKIFYANFSFPNCFVSMSIFVGIRQYFENKKVSYNFENIVDGFTKLSLGVYLIHPMIIEQVIKICPSIFDNNLVIVIPSMTIYVYIISLIISYFLSKVPIAKKYMI